MKDDYKRFIIPGVFSAIGIIVTFSVTQSLSLGILEVADNYSLVDAVAGTVTFDANFLLIVLIPVFLFEFLILSLPIAFFMLLIAKVFRITTYDIDVMRIGQGFDWIRIMKRAVVPSLFALSLGELVISLLQGLLFAVPEVSATEFRQIVPSLHPLLTTFGALAALTISIGLFGSTWILNDAGIVSHVKQKHLELRRCPDTEGIGRWYSNLIGGFGILAFPITMFNRYFFQKFVIYGVDPNPGQILISLGWTIGLPLIVIAFILPTIVLNELIVRWTSPIVQKIAKKFGASEVQLQHVGTLQPLDSQMMSEMESLSDSMEESDI
ncbi:MAG: hypothetical protein ACFFF9_04765 [Candidatus Thorarchaeota archaeon]